MLDASTGSAPASDRQVRRIQLDAAGIQLSALVGEPEPVPPRAVVIALHGAGLNADYFHGKAHPDVSLVSLGMRLGFTVMALDRPGYGASAKALPDGQTLRQQAVALHVALAWFADRHAVGSGFFLLAHSYGGKLALTAAAEAGGSDLIGLDISGCGHAYAADEPGIGDSSSWRRNWGALRCYPPGTFKAGESMLAEVPSREREEAPRWPTVFREIAARVRVPVRFTFAEHEAWWRHDEDALADLVSRFPSCPRILVDHQPGSGHNISLGWTARAYHLKALGFLEECLASRQYA